MALQDLLQYSNNRRKVGLSEERLREIVPVARDYIAYWREYPDMFVDFLQAGTDGQIPQDGLKFYFYQRVFLRVAMRYKYVYMVFPRAYSKSFLSVLTLMIRCVLYPDAHLFVTSGGKEQAAGIIKEKVEEICKMVPAFNKEIDWRRGKTQEGKDYCKYIFKNGSYFDNIAARETSRGKRRHGGLVEECVGVDGDILQQVIIPTMNVSRKCGDGNRYEEEVLNKSQIYVTTAGYKDTYSYSKLIMTLVQMITTPERAFIMGGTWRIPVLMKLIDESFIRDLKRDETVDVESFNREYESMWSGTVENAFFNGDSFDRNRILKAPEFEYSGRSAKNAYYILSVDVGRKGCDTVVCVFKVTPQSTGTYLKTLVNIYTYTDEHFENQAIYIKRLYYKYKARTIVLDGNGLGIGLIDYMIKPQEDIDTGAHYPDFGIENDDEGYYKKYRTDETEFDAVYIIKANAPINTEAHSNVAVQMSTGKVKFLIDERQAKTKLLGTVQGGKMSAEERAEYLRPFTLTSILKQEMLNLVADTNTSNVNIILKPANKGIHHDKFSAFEYGLYYIKQDEDRKRKRKRGRIADMIFMN